jgi:hypothetical protein
MQSAAPRVAVRLLSGLRVSPRLAPSQPSRRTDMVGRQIHDKPDRSTSVLMRERSIHSRTPISLKFSVGLPSVTATGRWRERGRMGRRV